MSARALVLVALGLSLAACSLITSLDGLAGGRVGPTDGGDGAMTDGAVVTTVDSSAGADASDGGDGAAGPLPFCASRGPSTFCDDFDGLPLATNWSELVGGITVDGTNVLTKPNALLSLVTTPSSCKFVQAGRSFTAPGKKASTRFAFRVGETGGGFAHFFGYIKLEHATDACALLLAQFDGQTAIMAQGKLDTASEFNDFFNFTTNAKVATWHVMKVDIDGTVSPPTMRAELDGVIALPVSPLPKCNWDGRSHLYLGMHCTSKTGVARFDDVEIQTQGN
jgi:hypothetical protein